MNEAGAESKTAIGRFAESMAWELLEAKGYRLVARNHRGDGGEVDIIAWDGDVLCFIEVRARADDRFGDPLESIDRQKIARIGRAAYHFLDRLEGAWPTMRFDAVGVTLSDPPVLRLVQDAFEL